MTAHGMHTRLPHATCGMPPALLKQCPGRAQYPQTKAGDVPKGRIDACTQARASIIELDAGHQLPLISACMCATQNAQHVPAGTLLTAW